MSPVPETGPVPFHGFDSEMALREFADALPDGLFTTDLAGRVTFWNRAASRITGWSAEEAVGRDCSLLAGDAVNGCACGSGPIRCGLLELGRTSKTCTLRTKAGRLLGIVKNATPTFAPDGQPTGALETFTAVGEVGFEPRCEWSAAATGAPDFHGLIGRHPEMEELYRTVTLVARSAATVMILGESGTGKERVAEAIHHLSPRAAAPFVRVSCSALDDDRLASELFGHVEGAFPGADEDRPGRFEEARGGTLLLDEIGDVSPAMQARLLRVLERREVERAGDRAPVEIDVRLLCTTHRDPEAMMEEGRFRADLYFRLASFPLRVPPLREHAEDVALLAEGALARVGRAGGPRPAGIAPDALEALRSHRWPGNVRELHNVLELAALRAGSGLIGLAHLPDGIRAAAGARGGANAPAHGAAGRRGGKAGAPPAEEILAMVERCGGNRAEAARRLGISRVTLWKWLKARGAGDGD